jgi:hypothetical protein
MANAENISGNQNIVIQNVQDSTITVNVNGEILEIERKLEALLALMQSWQAYTIQSANRIYQPGSISLANFEYILGQTFTGAALPAELAQFLGGESSNWFLSLKQELLKMGVSVGNRAPAIFQYYGWLIEAFLQKMGTPAGQERTLRRLAFMAEAFQSSLRYLCFIQVAQLLKTKSASFHPTVAGFLQMTEKEHLSFDYLNLLIISSEILDGDPTFVKEIKPFVQELSAPATDLYTAAIFLDKHRNDLIDGLVPTEAGALEKLLDEYLSALTYWLRKLAFLAKYRLISIKDINLKYRLGTSKNFVHSYGELHGIYTENYTDGEDYIAFSVENVFTYNQSVILIKGSNIDASLENLEDPESYLSLSPLIIDQSVFAERPTQTPEIYYYIGRAAAGRHYRYAQYKNELTYHNQEISSNKELLIMPQNNLQPKLNELFEQLEQLLEPLKTSRP